MQGTDSYSLWLEPSGKAVSRFQEKIKKLSKKYGSPLFSPHVTLLGALHASKTELVSLTHTLASTLHPIELTLTTVDYRNHFYQALFVHVEKSKQLMELRSMAEHLFDRNGDESYMPHLSLMYGDFNRKEKELILNEIGHEYYEKISVKSLELVKTSGNPEHWKRIYSAVLKDSP